MGIVFFPPNLIRIFWTNTSNKLIRTTILCKMYFYLIFLGICFLLEGRTWHLKISILQLMRLDVSSAQVRGAYGEQRSPGSGCSGSEGWGGRRRQADRQQREERHGIHVAARPQTGPHPGIEINSAIFFLPLTPPPSHITKKKKTFANI